jgi:hypothetical protein
MKKEFRVAQAPKRVAASTPTELVSLPGLSDVYAQLSAPFDYTFTDVRGGVELTYITGEQCVSRLNEVLGVAGWSYRVLQHGLNVEADEMWVLGEMEAEIGGKAVYRQQFGSQKVKRSRASGAPMDIGFDLKGAATDALKKCASLLGIGLYLSKKESAESRGAAVESTDGDARGATRDPGLEMCEDCGTQLKETRFKDGTTWGPSQLAGYGRRKHGKVLCMECYRRANESRKSALLSA